MKLLILLFVIIPLTSICQKTDSTKTKRFSVGVTFSADYCYRTLNSDSASKWIADSRNNREIPKFGFTTGVNFAYRINKRITLEAGILFSDKGEKTRKDTLIYNPPTVQTDPSLPIRINYSYQYLYIDIPIKVNVNILSKRTKLYIFAGVSPNIFIIEKTISFPEYSDGEIKRRTSTSTSEYNLINLAVIGGLGFSYDFNKYIYLKAEPTYTRSITSITHTPIKGYLYSFGLNVGLYYKI